MRVHSGVYSEGDLLTRLKGTEERPIVFMAAPGEKPILDSSLEIRKDSASWESAGNGVFVAKAPLADEPPDYLAQDGQRMFRYSTPAELKADRAKAGRAWCFDAKTRKVHLRTGSGKEPNQHTYHLSRHSYAFFLDRSEYIVVRGFTMRNYGAVAVRFSSGARGCVVIENTIHNSPGGVFLKGDTTRDNVIWRNEIYEPGLADFSWGAIKESDYPRQGIYCVAGRGTSICYNRIHGWFDCICPESWKNPNKLVLNRDCDVMFNDLYNAGDDAVEADGGGVNMRIHGNRIRNCLTALSLAPVERGPVYVTRNEATFRGLLFKLNVAGVTSPGWTYVYHNSGYSQTIGDDGGTGISFAPSIICTNKVFKNNALMVNEYAVRAGKAGNVLDANCYFQVPGKPPRKFQWGGKNYPTLSAFQKAVGQEKNGLYRDPLFESAPDLGKLHSAKDFLGSRVSDFPLAQDTKTGDLHLKAGSPCLDRGVIIRGINEDFQGKAPDIGAFETK